MNATSEVVFTRVSPRPGALALRNKILLLVLLFGLTTLPTLAQTNWIGTTNTDWNTATNWSAGIPDAADNVVIPTGTTNQPAIGAGTLAVAFSVEVQSGASLTIAGTGRLTVNGSKGLPGSTSAFFNSGTVQNSGQLVIGNTGSVGSFGLLNLASFFNNAGGTITIDRSATLGLNNNAGSTFTNAGTITIGGAATAGSIIGLFNIANFVNSAGGAITIDRSTSAGLFNSGGTFTNAAAITIGATASVGQVGLQNQASFVNNLGGVITIDRSSTFGLSNNQEGTFTNAATITIGATATVGGAGIQNSATFSNSACTGLINIVSNSIVDNTGTFTNGGTVIENASGNSSVSSNSGLVQNLNGGTFTITDNTGALTTASGLIWTGCTSTNWATPTNWSLSIVPASTDNVVIPTATTNQPIIGAGTLAVAYSMEVQSGASLSIVSTGRLTVDGAKGTEASATSFSNSGTVQNSGQLVIGNVPVGEVGLLNLASFVNNAGGIITIDRTTNSGLNNAAGTFTNAGTITIGGIASAGQAGLLNQANFINNAGAILIDRSALYGLYNQGGTFTNAATITIGGTLDGGSTGLYNLAAFVNNVGGAITIDRTNNNGLYNNSTSTFTNSATITIGATASVGENGLRNEFEAGFINTACAVVNLFARVNNTATFTNAGLLRVSTAQAHVNDTLTNNGIIEYLQGNPIPNVTNNTLTAAPLSICTSVSPALQLGGSNNFTAGSTWYKDQALTIAGGTYDQATNTFTVTNPVANSTYPLFFTVSDGGNTCPRLLTINVTVSTPPVATIGGTLTVVAGGTTTLTASGGNSFIWSTGQTTASITATAGPYSVTVANAGGCTSTASVTVTTVNGANQPPVATMNTNQTATVGTAFSYTVNAFTDAETPGSLTYSASITPANGLVFNPLTRVISGTPSVSGVSGVTITATDPGSLTASTSFVLTVSPASSVTTTAPFAITGVTTLSCTPVGDRINLSFAPQYTGTTGQPIRFAVVNELLPTTAPGPYTLQVYTDNPTLTLSATQNGSPTEASFVYNWLAACQTNPATNTTPRVVTPLSSQTATVGQYVSYVIPAGTFTDDETPGSLRLSASGLPAGLSFSGATLSGTPSSTAGSPASITLTATDPGGLSASTLLSLTVLPASAPPPPSSPFALTGVTTLSCTPVSDRINLVFAPRYGGLSGQPIAFEVVNELASTTDPGPYSLTLYRDNPVITLRASQSGSDGPVTFAYNWLAGCTGLGQENTPPRLNELIASQTALVGQGYSLNLTNTFIDQETPTQITLTAVGLPAGLSLSGQSVTGTPSLSGVSSVTLTATDPGSLSTSTSFVLTVIPASVEPPTPPTTGPFSITGVTTLSCEVVRANLRRVTFTPQYTSVSGEPISFSVVNEKLPTTEPGPYTLNLYTDNPIITLSARQGGATSTYAYSWLTACPSGARQPAAETQSKLQVVVLGNPIPGSTLEVEVWGAQGQPLRLSLFDARGQLVGERLVESAGAIEHQTIGLGSQPSGILLLRVSTATRHQTVKVVKP